MAMENPHVLKGNTSSNGPFLIAMLVYWSVTYSTKREEEHHLQQDLLSENNILVPRRDPFFVVLVGKVFHPETHQL